MAITTQQCKSCKNNKPQNSPIMPEHCMVYCKERIELTGNEEGCPKYVEKED